MKRFLIAVQFLTIIPIPYRLQITDKDLGRSMAYFPLVGLLLGGILYGFNQIATLVFSSRVADLGCVLTLVLLTGGLHLDGLADSADAFFSRKNRQRMLEIMRESQIGVMGTIAIVFDLLLKFELLSSLSPSIKGMTLILMPVIGRWAVVFQAAILPYARASQGLGMVFNQQVKTEAVFLSTLFTLLIVLLSRKLSGLYIMVLVLVLSLFFIWYVHRKIGGTTGDTMGAAIEIAEVATLALMGII